MLEGALVGSGLSNEHCKHEIDESTLPKWDKRVGKVFTCKKCGAELCRGTKPVAHNPRVRVSKKSRRLLKRLVEAAKDIHENTERSEANYQHF